MTLMLSISTTTNRPAPARLLIILIFYFTLSFFLQPLHKVCCFLVQHFFQFLIFFFQLLVFSLQVCNLSLHLLNLVVHCMVDDAPPGIDHSHLAFQCPVKFSPDGIVFIEESSGQPGLLHQFRDCHLFLLVYHRPNCLFCSLNLFFAPFFIQSDHLVVLAHIQRPILPSILL